MHDLLAFRESLAAEQPAVTGQALRALWWLGKGNRDTAHAIAAAHQDDPDCNLVHAHLHRVEGDEPNAQDWYAAAGVTPSALPFDDEWEAIARRLLAALPEGAHASGTSS